MANIPSLQDQLNNLINGDATQPVQPGQIQEVALAQNANVQIYYVKYLDADNKPNTCELTYNPTTGQASLVDASPLSQAPLQKNTTLVKGVSGVTEYILVNSPSIAQGKDYQQISDFMHKNHPNDDISAPVYSSTEKFQRSVVKTLVFKQ